MLDYKIQQDKIRAEEAAALTDAKEKEAAALVEQTEKKKARLDRLDEQVAVKEKAKATIEEINAMGKSAMIGSGFNVTADEMKKLKTLAKKSVTADKRIADTRNKQKDAEDKLMTAERDRDIWKNRYNSLMVEVKDFLSAIRNFPQKLLSFIDEHWQERRRERQQQKSYSQEAR